MSVICYCATGVMDLSGVFCVAYSGVLQDTFPWNSVGMYTCSVWLSNTQTPVANQLMVFLKYIGTEGNGASGPNQRNMFGIGKGSPDVFRHRVTTSILALHDVYCTWPDAEERRELAKLGEIKSDFPNCVGIADGTLFPLAFEPEATDAPDY